MGEVVKFIIYTFIWISWMFLIIFIACLAVFLEDELSKFLNIFYNTKIGSVLKKYHIFETVIIGLFLLSLLLAYIEM